MKTNFVESEFAPLKRVVLAQSQFYLPEEENELDTSFLSEKNLDLFDHKVGDVADLYPDMQTKWENEKVQMAQLLTSYGVEVIRPRMLTEFEKESGKQSGRGYANFFSRDPFFTIGHFVIEGNLRFPHRRLEVLPIRAILIEESKHPEAIYVATPQPDISQGSASEAGPFLEGGDVLVYGKTIFVGYSGLASNLNGISWLKSLLEHWDYNVVPVRLHPDILHLDCALSMVKDGLMIYCEEAFLDGVPRELKNWDKINVSLKEASLLMTNGLPLNESVYITDQSFTKLIAELEKYGMKVETLDYEVSMTFGGSFRCTTQALLRTTN
ncbi:amidinotransferase [Enterococcus silesiacus]|uniref:Amidinotransferase n=1 Tax=Enterococcus silesiacus TaxID=332949 RepID=A0A0S3KDT9_9ENTE|nr:arginine deiminase family protein [Enterococcus silesiacus]ALS02402.1 amidinotransferase [Enterococcus silesiacus]OJG91381.1 amidinotransferase [Enterococcus silesiacus]